MSDSQEDLNLLSSVQHHISIPLGPIYEPGYLLRQVHGKKLTIFPCHLCQLLDKEDVFVRTAAKQNSTSIQEILLRFWQTKGSLDAR